MADENIEPTFRPEKYRWLIRRKAIDLMNLDDEVSEMSSLLQECGECTAIAIEIREASKADLDVAASEVANYLRLELNASGKQKSETTVSSEVPLAPKYKEALKLLSQARLDAGLWASLMESMRGKSTQLRTTADLIQSGFIQKDYILAKRRKDMREVKTG